MNWGNWVALGPPFVWMSLFFQQRSPSLDVVLPRQDIQTWNICLLPLQPSLMNTTKGQTTPQRNCHWDEKIMENRNERIREDACCCYCRSLYLVVIFGQCLSPYTVLSSEHRGLQTIFGSYSRHLSTVNCPSIHSSLWSMFNLLCKAEHKKSEHMKPAIADEARRFQRISNPGSW